MKIKIENITLKEYFGLAPAKRAEYDVAIEYGIFKTEMDIFRMGDITKRSFGFVKDLQQLFETEGIDNYDLFKQLNEILISELDVSLEGIYQASCFDYFNFLKFVNQSVNRIQKLESNLIVFDKEEGKKPDATRFKKYGYFIQIDSLANGDPQKYDAIRAMTYETLFSKMMLEKDRTEYNNEYAERLKQFRK